MDADPRHYESVVVNDNDIHNIVMSYLVHNCYKETLESFASCTGTKQPSDYLEDMDKRKRIFHFVIEGNVLKAIDLAEQLAPDLLEKNKDLHFDLLSLRFVELVSSRKCTEALEFAQTKLSQFGKEQKYIKKLEVGFLIQPWQGFFETMLHFCFFHELKKIVLMQDFMALLAYYEEPEKSPMFHLLSLEYRQLVADNLNRAILAHANLPSHTAMERLIQQVTTVSQCLSQEVAKDRMAIPHFP